MAALDQRVGWNERYGLAILASATLPTPHDFNTDIAWLGIASADQLGLPLTDKPSFNPNLEISQTRKTTGSAVLNTGVGCERVNLIKRPSVTLQIDECDPATATILLWLLCQTGSSDVTNTQTHGVYASPSVEVWADVVRAAGTNVDNDLWERITGCIVTSLTFSLEVGGVLSCTAELPGSAYTEALAAGTWSLLELPTLAPLLHKNALITLGGASNYIECDSWTLTLINSAIGKPYDESAIQKWILGDFVGTGSLKVPWMDSNVGDNTPMTNYLAGTEQQLNVYWGSLSGSADQDVSFKCNVRYTGDLLEDGDEVGHALDFEICDSTGKTSFSSVINTGTPHLAIGV